MKKDILFFSNYDGFSKKILDKLSINNIKDIVMVCVDDSNIKIPSFIKVVPTIYNHSKKQIIIDEDIDNYINSIIKNEETKLDNVKAYNNMQDLDSFHSIDLNSKNDDNSDLSMYFQGIDNNLEQLSKNATQNLSVDSLQQSRKQDLNKIFSK